jgi:hypothetical protein
LLRPGFADKCPSTGLKVMARFGGVKNYAAQFMAILSLFVLPVSGLVGCAAEQKVEGRPLISGHQPYEDLVYESLSREPVPLPAITPYDSDKQKRGAYLRGFADAWHYVISGTDLHGDGPTYFYQSTELNKIWSAGYETGRKLAWERWKQEDLRLRQE